MSVILVPAGNNVAAVVGFRVGMLLLWDAASVEVSCSGWCPRASARAPSASLDLLNPWAN